MAGFRSAIRGSGVTSKAARGEAARDMCSAGGITEWGSRVDSFAILTRPILFSFFFSLGCLGCISSYVGVSVWDFKSQECQVFLGQKLHHWCTSQAESHVPDVQQTELHTLSVPNGNPGCSISQFEGPPSISSTDEATWRLSQQTLARARLHGMAP